MSHVRFVLTFVLLLLLVGIVSFSFLSNDAVAQEVRTMTPRLVPFESVQPTSDLEQPIIEPSQLYKKSEVVLDTTLPPTVTEQLVEPTPVVLSVDEPLTNTSQVSQPSIPGGGINLTLDDGTAENGIGLTEGGQFLWLNRFTPAPTDYPFILTEIQLLFNMTSGVEVGEIIDLYVYEDTDGDGDPSTGAVLVGSATNQEVQGIAEYFSYSVNMELNGPGDVLIAVVNRTAGIDPDDFAASTDTTESQQRSWIGTYSDAPPNPPTLPAPGWSLIDDITAVTPGNWMIRGIGVKVVQDGSFEAGTPNPFWDEFSSNFNTPLCSISCDQSGGMNQPHTGDWWIWFGGVNSNEEGRMSQQVTIPSTMMWLNFYLEQRVCDSEADYMEVLIDGTQIFLTTGASSLCGQSGYTLQSIDISAFADNGTHSLEFHSEIFANNGTGSNFFVDDVSINEEAPATPTPTPTNTSTVTHTPTQTATPTVTQTPTSSATSTVTRTPTRTLTPTPSSTDLYLPLIIKSPPPPPTPTPTRTPTVTVTPMLSCITTEQEPNNTSANTLKYPPLCEGVQLPGVMPNEDDELDIYRIEVAQAGTIKINLTNIPEGTNYNLRLFDNNANEVADSSNSGNTSESISLFINPGRYYIRIFAIEGRSDQNYLLRWDLE